MDDIGFAKVDDGVAVGMRIGHVKHRDLIAVEVKCDALREGDDRQAFLGQRRLFAAQKFDELLARKALAYIVLRHNQRARLAQINIAAGMVAMPMGVDHKADRLWRQQFDRRFNFRRQRRELVINQEYAVRPDRQAHIAAGTDEHIHRIAQLVGFDFNFVELLLRLRRGVY